MLVKETVFLFLLLPLPQNVCLYIPDLPTMRELGYDWEQTSWRALMVHRDTPDEIVRQLEKAAAEIYTSEGTRKAVGNWETLTRMRAGQTGTS